ncbi:hypothetical protein DC498_09435 [Terrimonas sp.]|uniref:hypothetical protein n=1 Tax=Terrimonas sp. TaxID=1914338 RepID=UPI000D5073EE|nr:hypothetical protein [Terrimonas sp.]PVD52333.1 hypothetical protein DC498_09435 [Terrimonas sp.]
MKYLIRRPLMLLLPVVLFFSCQKTLDEPDPVVPDPDPDPVVDSPGKFIPVKFIIQSDGKEHYDSLVYDAENRLIAEWFLDPDGSGKIVYTYKNGQPASMEYYTLFPEKLYEKSTYSDKVNNSVTETYTYFDEQDGTALTTTRTYLYNEKGQLYKGLLKDGTVFEELGWDEKGRLNTMWYKESADLSFQFKYDDKKGIFSSVNAPFFFDAFLSTTIANFNINNLTETAVTYKNSEGQTMVEKTTYSYTYNDAGYPVTLSQADQFGVLSAQIEYKEIK